MTSRVGIYESTENRAPWWVILLTGIASVILGILLLTAPGITTVSLVTFLGAYWFVSGIFSIVEIFTDSRSWGWKLLLGVIGILAGLTVLQHPITSAIVVPTLVVTFVAIEGILFGVIHIVRAFRERSAGLGILGLLSILFGGVILSEPLLAAIGLPFVVGVLALAGGIVAIIDAFRVRGRERLPTRVERGALGREIPVTGQDRERRMDEEETDRPESG